MSTSLLEGGDRKEKSEERTRKPAALKPEWQKNVIITTNEYS